MNDSFNPYQFDAEPENVSRTGDFDLEDYEEDGKNCPPWPKTPFTVELYRRKWFRKEHYRLTVNQTDFLLESEHLDAPIRGSRSSAKKCLFGGDAFFLLVKYPGQPQLFLKPVFRKSFVLHDTLLTCWQKQIEDKNECQKQIRQGVHSSFVQVFIGIMFLVSMQCFIFAFIVCYSNGTSIPFKIFSVLGNIAVIYLTWMSTKCIWPLYIFQVLFIGLTIFMVFTILRSHGFPHQPELFITTGVCLLFPVINLRTIIRLRRAVKDPLYRENIGEM